MLYSLVLHLRALKDASVRATLGYQAYALFLAILRRADPALAQQLHSGEGVKPFTVGAIQGPPRREAGKTLVLKQGAPYRLRLTFLEDGLFASFLHALLQHQATAPLRLDTAEFVVEEVLTTSPSSRWAGCRDFADLLAEAKPREQVTLHFVSPTTFRSGGRRNVLFPTPALVFGSYLARWNAFSPVKLPPHLAKLFEEALIISRYSLRSRMLDFGRYQEAGFQGSCEFQTIRDLPEDDRIALDALSRFAFFCGTGAKTTMGMGQTWRLDDAGAVSDGTGRNAAQERRAIRRRQGR